MTKPLYGRTHSTMLRLDEAVQSCAMLLQSAPCCALLYAPDRCYLARLNQKSELVSISYGYDHVPRESPVNFLNVYEARVFNERAELRWLHEGHCRGRIALLSEDRIAAYFTSDIPEITPLETLPQQYLLWGEGVASDLPARWSRLTSARIGRLNVPYVDIGDKQRVQLHTREYLCEVDKHGNVAVVEERLLKLEVAK